MRVLFIVVAGMALLAATIALISFILDRYAKDDS